MEAGTVRHLITADEYERMAEACIFDPDERMELVEGELYSMAPIGLRHAVCVDRINFWFGVHAGGRVQIRVQGPARVSPGSEPQPDVMLLRRRDDFYRDAHPGPADILLLIEVSDTSLRFDRGIKLPIYAAMGIPEAWIVDLPDEAIDIYREPGADGYRFHVRLRQGDEITPAALPDLRIPVAELLP